MGIDVFILSIIASAIGGAGLTWMSIRVLNRSAPRRYFNRIKKQIDHAISEGIKNAHRNAKIIVTSRNRLRESLSVLGHSLNGEIDKLESLIFNIDRPKGDGKTFHEDKSEVDINAIFNQIQVLKGYWAANEDTIEGAIKKVLVDLNII